MRDIVRDVVLSLSPKPFAVALAQTQAAILHWNAALTATLLVRVEEELRRLTRETASEFNVVPEQVRAWRAVYDPAGAPLESGAAPVSKQPPAKPEAHTAPPPSPATTPVKPPARVPSRTKSEPPAGRAPARDEPAAGADASAPAGAAWRPLPGSKQDLSASVANALGTSLAGALSRALGDKITGRSGSCWAP